MVRASSDAKKIYVERGSNDKAQYHIYNDQVAR